ncbi:hypothetical protein [Microvirga makkahensis]|uniref:Uncharacterized protein n=1 Tax=Microvirga makkahensis TaxID=1128670 RepID=A0A7X3MVF8_9HYPH|nr:hypothetical protein [Microvirga makkahensis]MXQ13957.1 hypothetical protein [Microvirga makkahensis]
MKTTNNRSDAGQPPALILDKGADGSITRPQVQPICGIEGTDFGHYHCCHGEKIDGAVRMVSQGEHRYLITYEDGAATWDIDDWNDARLEVDGPA